MRLLTLNEIRDQVGQWSRNNFADQRSKYQAIGRLGDRFVLVTLDSGGDGSFVEEDGYPTHFPKAELVPLILEHRNPMRGMSEEISEYLEAESVEAMLDALADVAIYLCDYAARRGFDFPLDWEEKRAGDCQRDFDPIVGVQVWRGRIERLELKLDQGIYALGDGRFESLREQALRNMLWYLNEATEQVDGDVSFLHLVNTVWARDVAKRNWIYDPEKGGKRQAVTPLHRDDFRKESTHVDPPRRETVCRSGRCPVPTAHDSEFRNHPSETPTRDREMSGRPADIASDTY